MPMPTTLDGKLALPVIASPLFIVSGPDLVIEQCTAGIVDIDDCPPVADVVARMKTEYADAKAALARLAA
ncbi:hypothetical protein BKK79_27280 [Cupriavidus sp. USMAA2-4]|uniref:hypothetical protein n=1 Tax=Cupriavidus sp. USMAA2-4 TaxID=876364 RepID=UPI0008A6976C|nr:hypothetical protein BKK79_27280 [Cupriavidus sp. USMAA2-4]